MKKIVIIFISLLLVSCMQTLDKPSTKQNYLVKGTINGEYNDFIKISYDGQIDSVKLNNNTFQFEGEVSSPKAFQFEFDSMTSSEVFYLENDTLIFDVIVDEVELEEKAFNEFDVKQLSGGKTQGLKNYVTSLLKSTSKSKKNRDILLYKTDSLIKAYPNHDYLGKLLSKLSMNQDLLYNDVRSLISKLDVDELNPQDISLLENYQQKRRNFQIGSEIPDYELISITSETENLKPELSKYNLIQFWNSWCEQCKSEQGELLEIYQKYNFKDFEIIGISLNANYEDWISAVSLESVPWKSLRVENGFTGKMPSDMGIIDLPQYYLVDQKGRIIEINLSLDELNSILSALLN